MIRFSVISFVAIVVLGLVAWALTGFSTFGLDADDFKFLFFGSLFTIMLAVGLMAAIFYSNRSGSDAV